MEIRIFVLGTWKMSHGSKMSKILFCSWWLDFAKKKIRFATKFLGKALLNLENIKVTIMIWCQWKFDDDLSKIWVFFNN